jgi:hypothetical protein
MGIRTPLVIPPPHTRVSVGMYADLRAWLLDKDPDAAEMVEWSSRVVGEPVSAEAMAGEIVWIILCAGRSAQAARTIERKVWAAIHAGEAAVTAFGYRAKAAAIDSVWLARHEHFASLRAVMVTGEADRLVEWCGSLPFVGADTQFQLAKNFGADLAKPDRWLTRLAGLSDRPRRSVAVRFPACMNLCRPLAAACGDRIATVDSLLWLACNKGVLVVDAFGGPVTFIPEVSRRRSIYESAG